MPRTTCNQRDSPQWILQFIEVTVSRINHMEFFPLVNFHMAFFYFGKLDRNQSLLSL